MHFSSIRLILRTLSVATTPGQCGPGSDGNEATLRIPQSSSITGTSPSGCLDSYPGNLLERGSYPSAEMQSVCSTAPTDWAIYTLCRFLKGLVLWHINLCRLFNAKSIFFVNNQFYLKQFGLAWVHSLIVKNISISSCSVIYNNSV